MRTQHPARHLVVVPPPSEEQDADEQLTDDTDRPVFDAALAVKDAIDDFTLLVSAMHNVVPT